ncbi:ribose-5-phosphate isomerase [Halobacillus andaensis]|uniref:Ribose 5-phosphate isomerase A n=1 Tax=Halobacillus andaensis TaxID=1176239 RepID=A0A917B486_HALAA|nr:ribose 5-phosphate isomerase A [Halobacillus andaensis]MBP2004543.1 ribose 5-phosphate isomerase A [Halobacillus andaensis]GGF20866.1 ribose-5-phosphate isomerase [Halobacillus andaensis]
MKWENPLYNTLSWSGEIDNRQEKEKAAKTVSKKVSNGDIIGVGSGSTSLLALEAIGRRVREEAMEVKAIPTSKEAALNCAYFGVPTTTLTDERPSWGFDGADEVDGERNLIKGRGGALLAEKLVMASSPLTYILVDSRKFVKKLGEKSSVPIEVDPRAIHLVETELIKSFHVESVQLRMAVSKDGPVITESGNVIFDVKFQNLNHKMEYEVKAIPGVVETGLFLGYSVEILTS